MSAVTTPDSSSGLKRILTSHPALARAAMAWTVYEAATQIQSRATDVWRKKMSYTVTVKERDALYRDAQEWALSLLPEQRRRSLEAALSAAGRDDVAGTPDDPGKTSSRVRLAYNDTTARPVTIDGHRVVVTVTKPEAPEDRKSYRPEETIEFRARTQAGQATVIAHLNRIAADRSTRAPMLHMVSPWGSWERRSDIPSRPWHSVVLPHDQSARVEQDLKAFLDAEDQYVQRGIPWHRGYMFHGPPGTGKTSLVKALANRFGLDLWYVPLADLKEESSLMSLLSAVSPRSILLLEDIDTVAVANDRDGSDQGTISTGSLLNALDGVATPHGLITFMTTNRFEVLDEAMVRAGRMDLVEYIGYPGAEEIDRLFGVFHRQGMSTDIRNLPGIGAVSQAEVAEVLKRNMTSPERGEQDLYDLLAGKVVTADG